MSTYPARETPWASTVEANDNPRFQEGMFLDQAHTDEVIQPMFDAGFKLMVSTLTKTSRTMLDWSMNGYLTKLAESWTDWLLI